MAKQRITIADNGDGTATVTIGLFGHTVEIASLFPRGRRSRDSILAALPQRLREKGFSSLTPGAMADVAAADFEVD